MGDCLLGHCICKLGKRNTSDSDAVSLSSAVIQFFTYTLPTLYSREHFFFLSSLYCLISVSQSVIISVNLNQS